MKSLKKIIQRRLLGLTSIVMVVILIVALFFQIMLVQAQTRSNADSMFAQVHTVLYENSHDLEKTEAAYRETCIQSAEAISYVLELNTELLELAVPDFEIPKNSDPKLRELEVGTLEKVAEFQKVAKKLGVDEIHIFDSTGRIITGTHTEYFNFTFDDGEQIGFFKPMLDDKELILCQDITPNTAEQKLVQYSAIWCSDKEHIIQVGMYPNAVLDVTAKNELSYIFSLLGGTPGVSMYAVSTDGRVVGSTSEDHNGKLIGELGIPLSELPKYRTGAHLTVAGVDSFCIFTEIDGNWIGYIISVDEMYTNVGLYTLLLIICLIIITGVMVIVATKYTDRYIVGSIAKTNERLRTVAEGDLDERVDVQSSREFSELSSHINRMIRRLLSETDKMSLVLNRTNLRIGVYEYTRGIKTVRFTEHIPEIFGFTPEEMSKIANDYKLMQTFIDSLRLNPVSGAENTYRFVGRKEMYIKLEEISNDSSVLGIIMDVTEETVRRKKAEAERDHDQLTELYNRRGMMRRLEKLFENPSEMGSGAIIMIDSDNLKYINDHFGHGAGDNYLKYLANILQAFEAPKKLAARTGGDEFVLLIYGYENDSAAKDAVKKIRDHQDTDIVDLGYGKQMTLYFSYGYELTRGRDNYELMLSAADVNMYNSKRMRKKAFNEKQAQLEESKE